VALHAMAQGRAHTRHQFADTEWFVDEIVGAEVQRLDLLRLAFACGQHHDRHIRPGPHRADHIR
jgi:hypothetical protein